MADLGNIGSTQTRSAKAREVWWIVAQPGYTPNVLKQSKSTTFRATKVPQWYSQTGEPASITYPQNGFIGGVVQINGVAQAGVKVRLYRPVAPAVIQEAITNTQGQYYFYGLNPSISDYYVVFMTPPVGTLYNAQIRASITPQAI